MDFTEVDELAANVKAMRPLSKAELERLQEEFIVENTYNSCAIEGNSLTLEEVRFLLYRQQKATLGKPFAPIIPPHIEDKKFLGWYLDKDHTIPFIDGTIIEGDIDLYGKWEMDLE